MSKPLAAPPDAERVTKDYLDAQLAVRGDSTKVGVGLPDDWTPGSGDFVQVELDGTPTVQYPALWVATVRISSWSGSRTKAKDRAGLCEALMLAHPGDRAKGVAGCRPGTGILVARDRGNGGIVASVTVRLRLRGLPL